MFPPLGNSSKSISNFSYSVLFLGRKFTEFHQNSNFLISLQRHFLKVFQPELSEFRYRNQNSNFHRSQNWKPKLEFPTKLCWYIVLLLYCHIVVLSCCYIVTMLLYCSVLLHCHVVIVIVLLYYSVKLYCLLCWYSYIVFMLLCCSVLLHCRGVVTLSCCYVVLLLL